MMQKKQMRKDGEAIWKRAVGVVLLRIKSGEEKVSKFELDSFG